MTSGGKIHIPRQRRRDCSSRIRLRLTISACVSMSRFVSGLDFRTGSAAGFLARQNAFTGQTRHFGFRATQISAPRSSNAELKIAASHCPRRFAECCQSVFRPAPESMDCLRLKSRAKTRAVFASTMGTDCLKAKLAIACAEYFPMPGSRCISSTERGKRPWCCSSSTLAEA